MRSTDLKAMTQTRDLKAGHFVFEFATPGIGHIIKQAGGEFVLLDTEHSGFGFETVKSLLQYFKAADLPAIVRVPSSDYKDIARACDAGAEGVMLPMVGTAAQAKSIVQSMKYTPRGGRGVIVRAALDDYAPGDVMAKLATANARTTLFAQIETEEGVENAAEIAAVDGVDCLWVGHFDLSCSLGIPAQFDHPKFVAANQRVVDGAKAAGKSLGRLVPDIASGVSLYKQGFDFIAYSADAWVLGDALAAALADIRSQV
ncbi:MAG TPA: aldolase/citrate lyase family protein [Thermohalobaculum sp.]|nr:aldolase/citrate lyase family protein [Thermohalobaculum sp.]